MRRQARNERTSFQQRKLERREYYERFVKGWKEVVCGACNGSGRYDTTGPDGESPDCSSCEGSGKERVSPTEYARRVEIDNGSNGAPHEPDRKV